MRQCTRACRLAPAATSPSKRISSTVLQRIESRRANFLHLIVRRARASLCAPRPVRRPARAGPRRVRRAGRRARARQPHPAASGAGAAPERVRRAAQFRPRSTCAATRARQFADELLRWPATNWLRERPARPASLNWPMHLSLAACSLQSHKSRRTRPPIPIARPSSLLLISSSRAGPNLGHRRGMAAA